MCRQSALSPDEESRFRQLVSSDQVNVNATDAGGCNGIHWLCLKHTSDNLLELVKCLVVNGTDIRAKTDEGINPLHYLCAYENSSKLLQVAEYLLDQGTNVHDTLTSNNFNALHLLCWFNKSDYSPQLARILINRGIDAKARGKNRANALDVIYQMRKVYPDPKRRQLIRILQDEGVLALYAGHPLNDMDAHHDPDAAACAFL